MREGEEYYNILYLQQERERERGAERGNERESKGRRGKDIRDREKREGWRTREEIAHESVHKACFRNTLHCLDDCKDCKSPGAKPRSAGVCVSVCMCVCV